LTVPQLDSLHLVGLSHQRAALELRELFAFSADEITALLERAASDGRTAVLLSTCNRCELYWHGDHDGESWFRELGAARGVQGELPLLRLRGRDVAAHLMRVASGLESQILGETEILGQVRRAYDFARAAGATDHVLDLLFSSALGAGRRVRHETLLGRHPVSVSAAAVESVREEWGGGVVGRRVVVLGAGEVAEGVLRALHGTGAIVTLVNRHPERAAALGAAWGVGDVGGWERLEPAAREADLLLVATAAAEPTVTAELLAGVMAARPERPLWVVDLAVPRNVAPAARAIDGVRLIDLDGLQARRCPVPRHTMPQLPEVDRIIDHEITRLTGALRARAAAPKLAELHRVSAELAEREVDWALSRLSDLSESEQAVVRQMAERLVRRVLYPVSRAIRSS
jgi:glutamyl-tRNA reductase